jgi:hypothetical protein
MVSMASRTQSAVFRPGMISTSRISGVSLSDDRLVSRSVRGLSGDSNLAIFVVHAKGIARYSRITQGVGVSQVPALVIVRPKRVSGSVPEAQVAYGFRDSQTVVQYVQDALYSGKDDLPYSPR